MWNGARDIIKEKAGPIKEVSVNCDLLNSALNYYQIVRKLCPKSLIFFTIPKIMVSYVCEHNWNLFSIHPLNVSVLF